MSLAHWIFLDSNCTDTTDIYCFTKYSNKPKKGYFAIIAEELPQNIVSDRSKTGAKLLIDASQLALEELQKQELDFSPHFFNLLNEAWKTKVLLHAIQNPFPNTTPLSIEKLTENDTLSGEVVRNYDASVGIIYVEGKQLIHVQSGETQLALLNKRYNCEIKKADQQSLSTILNSASPSYQIIDIEKYQLEMMALLPRKYTAPKIGARLKSNILKIYRSFESSKLQTENNDNTQLLILKRDKNQTKKTVITKKITSSVAQKKEPSKRSMATYALSVFFLISGVTASYFLWQVQAEENASPPYPSDNFSTTQLALNNTQEVTFPKKVPLEVTDKQFEIKKQVGEFEHDDQKQVERHDTELVEKEAREKKERDLKLQQQEKEQAAIDEVLKTEAELIAKKTAAEKEKKRQQQKEEQAAIAETLRVKVIEAEKARKEQALKEKLEAEAKDKKLQQQQEEASLRSIEKDLEVINRHDAKIRTQQQAEEQKRREKQAKAKLAETLIKKRRREFENNKNKQLQSAPVKAVTSKSREALQLQNQEHIKQKEVEKKRSVSEELKKQQIGQIKAKEAREKVIQKTITHQLMNYSKTFHRHVVQLKQKNQAIELLEQRKASSNDPNIIRNQKMLQSKKNDIEQHIDRLAILYVEKLKRLCTNKVIHPVAMPAKLTAVERIALTVISQKLRNCSQPQTLSSQSISKTLVNRYSK